MGAGRLALPKVERLVDFGAHVDIVAPLVISEIQEILEIHVDRVKLNRRNFAPEDVERITRREYLLVFACTNDNEENARVLQAAKEAGVLAHVPDSPEQSNFILPSVLKRGHLKISVATDGLSPLIGKALRQKIEAALGTEIDKYVLFIDSMREKLVELESDPRLGNPLTRREIARQLAESEEILLALQRESFEEAGRLVQMFIAEAREAPSI